MSRSSRRLSVLIAALAVAGAASASAGVEAEAGEPITAGATDLRLEVFRNGVDTGLIAAFQRRADGRFTSTGAELRAIGLAPPGGVDPVFLDRMPGVAYRYDEIHQQIFIDAQPAVLAPTIISFRAPPVTTPVSQDVGALLNYSLATDAGDLGDHGRFHVENVEGAFEARAFGPFGLASSAFDVDAEPGDVRETRLDTTWIWADPGLATTWRAGDFISGGFSWTRPIRLGGFQVRRDFGTRPDLITTPTPVLSATAAAPSTLDVMLGSALVLSRPVPAGPVQVSDIPVLPGQGEARLVLRDALGVQQQVVAAYFATPDLLREGVVDFSAEAGFARRDFGLLSNDYDAAPVGSASVRYGLSDRVTLQGHVEGGDGLANIGGGWVHALGAFGAVSAAAAASDDRSERGELVAVGFDGQIAGAALSAQAQQTLGAYRDLAAVTAPPPTAAVGADPPYRTLLQVVLSAPLYLAGLGSRAQAPTLALSYAQAREDHQPQRATISAALRYQIARRINLQAAAYVSSGPERDTGFSLAITTPLGANSNAAAGLDRTGGLTDAYVEASQPEQPRTGATAWRLRVDEQPSATDLEAEGVYRASFGRLGAQASLFDGDAQVRGTIDGAVVWLGAPMLAPDRIDGAFAMVDVGAPRVAVSQNSAPVGISDARGWLLVRNLASYAANRLEIDTENLPLDLAEARSAVIVNPPYGAGALIRFGVAPTPPQARVSLLLEDGRPVPAGARAALNGASADLVVGYDGEVFLSRPSTSNLIRVDLGDGGACTARFVIDPATTVRRHAANLVCKSSAPIRVAGIFHSGAVGPDPGGQTLAGPGGGELHSDGDERQLRLRGRFGGGLGDNDGHPDLLLHRHDALRAGDPVSEPGRWLRRRDGLRGPVA